MQCTVKYITSSAILVLPLLLLFLPTLISSLSRRDCLPTLTGTFDNHIIGMCLLCLYEVSIYEIFLRGRARTIYTYSGVILPWGLFIIIIPITILKFTCTCSSTYMRMNSCIFHFTTFFGNGCDFFYCKVDVLGKERPLIMYSKSKQKLIIYLL